MSQFKKDTDDKFVIIGAGFAAMEAVKAIRARNATASLVLVGEEPHNPYYRIRLPQVVCEDLTCESLAIQPETFFSNNNVEFHKGVCALGIDAGQKQVSLDNGETLRYTRLLLATGSNPFNPIESTPDSIPVRVLRRYEDAVALRSMPAGSRVVLVGGGILGVEAALALHKAGFMVTVVEFAPRLMPLQADEHASVALQAALENTGIHVLCGTSVASATPTGVVFTSGAEMAADCVLASMGVRSEVSLAVALGLELSRGIVVDENMHTSHRDIWAAGDCAEFDGRVLALASVASAMGRAAGASMAGDESAPYRPSAPATMLRMEGFSLFSVGEVSPPDNEEAEDIVYKNGDVYKRLLFRDGGLSGALFLGTGPVAGVADAVRDGQPLDKALALLV